MTRPSAPPSLKHFKRIAPGISAADVVIGQPCDGIIIENPTVVCFQAAADDQWCTVNFGTPGYYNIAIKAISGGASVTRDPTGADIIACWY